ncbi:hypothetical protein [Nocardia sp. SC052]|uniref:hypothetical protein n=1 Tax=Nocardia sichangensis TaxID=3385975 RepID=UPI00399EEF84
MTTDDDREQMTRALSRQIRKRTPADQRQARALAEHLIELGWTLPSEPRAIGSAEELDALPVGSVIRTGHGLVRTWVCGAIGYWTNGPSFYASKTVMRACGPGIAVLWQPEREDRT